MPSKVTGFAPIPSVPGENPAADAHNILVWGLHGDWKRIEREVGVQDRIEVEQTLAMVLCMLCVVLKALPDKIGCHFMEHFETQSQDPEGWPYPPRSERQ